MRSFRQRLIYERGRKRLEPKNASDHDGPTMIVSFEDAFYIVDDRIAGDRAPLRSELEDAILRRRHLGRFETRREADEARHWMTERWISRKLGT